MKKYLITLFLITSLNVIAQDGSYQVTEESYEDTTVEMADLMRSNGKIYVVVGIIMVIFLGIIFYMVNVDRKISKIEREVFSEKANP